MKQDPKLKEKEQIEKGTFHAGATDNRVVARKRKTKSGAIPDARTLDLNIPLGKSAAIVPVGLVTSRVHQLGGDSELSEAEKVEAIKK